MLDSGNLVATDTEMKRILGLATGYTIKTQVNQPYDEGDRLFDKVYTAEGRDGLNRIEALVLAKAISYVEEPAYFLTSRDFLKDNRPRLSLLPISENNCGRLVDNIEDIDLETIDIIFALVQLTSLGLNRYLDIPDIKAKIESIAKRNSIELGLLSDMVYLEGKTDKLAYKEEDLDINARDTIVFQLPVFSKEELENGLRRLLSANEEFLELTNKALINN